MDYSQFTAEDFIMDESFQHYCIGNNKEAELFWTKCIADNPLKKEEITKAKELFFLLNGAISAASFKNDEVAFISRLKKQGIIKTEEEAKLIQMPMHEKANGKWRFQTWRAAAAILLAVVFTGVFFILNKSKQSITVAKTNAPLKPGETDIAPGGDKAVLTLGDGRKIILDSAANGAVTEQGGIRLIKLGGQLSYSSSDASTEVLYNTVSTPKGGQYQLLLADGTKVWLNAASSLRFPTTFKGEERSVELTGEGYFEVAHNAAMPFRVKVADMDVQVLGTHFNVMAYDNEGIIKTTLLEGKVKVRKALAIKILLQGQQAQVNNDGEIKLEKNADVDAAIAWKNGLFQLNGADVKTIGRQIERWYDVEVSYSGNLQSAHLSGEVPRTLNLSQVIKLLETSGIDVKMTGRNLLVTPKP